MLAHFVFILGNVSCNRLLNSFNLRIISFLSLNELVFLCQVGLQAFNLGGHLRNIGCELFFNANFQLVDCFLLIVHVGLQRLFHGDFQLIDRIIVGRRCWLLLFFGAS